MKGPFERLKYDLRRIWECPQCGHKVRTDGTVTTQFCRCGKSNPPPGTKPAVMKLVGDGPRRLVPPAPKPKIEPEPVVQVDVIAAVATIVETTTIDQLPSDSAEASASDQESRRVSEEGPGTNP